MTLCRTLHSLGHRHSSLAGSVEQDYTVHWTVLISGIPLHFNTSRDQSLVSTGRAGAGANGEELERRNVG